jgi:hypothetical protein
MIKWANPHYQKVISYYKKADCFSESLMRWTITEPELGAIEKVVAFREVRNMAVVGVHKGFSSLLFIEECDGRFEKLYNIDPFFDSCDSVGSSPLEKQQGISYHAVYRKVLGIQRTHRSVLGEVIDLHGFSTTASETETTKAWSHLQHYYDPDRWFKIKDINAPLDLCFIDGEHANPTCLNDFCFAWQKMSPGGIMLLHDISKTWEDFTQRSV